MTSCAQGQDYPPWLRIIDLAYDYDNGRARLAIKEGYEKGKTYVRRYDQVRSSGWHQHTAMQCRSPDSADHAAVQDREYMTKGGTYAACERAYLGTWRAPALVCRWSLTLLLTPRRFCAGEEMPRPLLPDTAVLQVRAPPCRVKHNAHTPWHTANTTPDGACPPRYARIHRVMLL